MVLGFFVLLELVLVLLLDSLVPSSLSCLVKILVTLLQNLLVLSAVVSLDENALHYAVMTHQVEIAKALVEHKGKYFFFVKNNHSSGYNKQQYYVW